VPNFENAPFRLLAIVNRMDLSAPLNRDSGLPDPPSTSSPAYYRSAESFDSTGGEGRFIFSVIEDDKPDSAGTTLILEYALPPGNSADKMMEWASDWHSLGGFEDFGSDFRVALTRVTRKFTHVKLSESRTLGNLMRIRVNDGSFGKIREFREFGVSSTALAHSPLLGTPKAKYFARRTKENRELARHLRHAQIEEEDRPSSARVKILESRTFQFVIPLAMISTVAPIPENDASYHWDAISVKDDELRREFSMQTCCGCQCGDTKTAFFHVRPRLSGEESPLSKFLNREGEELRITDLASKRRVKMNEMEDRKLVFEGILKPDLSLKNSRNIRERRVARAHSMPYFERSFQAG
jgi:hypothetical protein